MFTRRQFLALSLPTIAFAQAAAKPVRKGACTLDRAVAEALKAGWYYDWSAYGGGAAGLEFVPMVKGKPHFKPGYWEHVATLKAKGAAQLLGFNEPERGEQGNLTVAEALDLWPKLEATALRLGSPAPSSDGKGMAWLAEFMAGVKKRKLRVDFVALHWYRDDDLAKFEGWLREMHQAYDRPLWLTEFNAWNAKQRDQEKFLKGAVKIIERLRFVERYAFFSPGPKSEGSLVTSWNPPTLTKLGEWYRDQ